MRINAGIERLAGAAAVVVVACLIGGMALHPGIDTREQYFRESWTDASGSAGALAVSAGFMFAGAAAVIVTAVALLLALWRTSRAYAIAVAGALLPAGIAFASGAAVNLAMRELLGAWRASNFQSTELLAPSRAVAQIGELSLAVGTLGPISAFLLLGWVILRHKILPRWVAAPAMAGALVAVAGLAALPLRAGDLAWAAWALSMLLTMLFLLLFAVMLLSRGIGSRPTTGPRGAASA